MESKSERSPKKLKQLNHSLLVAIGILLSRIFGLVRERIFAHYLGNSWSADAFRAAMRIPNLLQNLLGEGVLSASFIPIYAQMLAAKGGGSDLEVQKKADRFAVSLLALLSASVFVLVAIGIAASSLLVDVLAPGFDGEKRELTILLVQIFFPATGLLVLSAWCLGVLNSHQKFFMSYVSPVFWNLSIIFGLWYFGGRSQSEIATKAAWFTVLGGFIQVLVQAPSIVMLIKSWSLELKFARGMPLRRAVTSFVPAVSSRGVVQLSAFVDSILASFLPSGAVSVLAYVQTLYMLPISLFGMSVTAAELPQLSKLNHLTSSGALSEEARQSMHSRIQRSLARIHFFVIPCAIVFLILGDSVVGLIFKTGSFTQTDVSVVWFVLIGQSIGLLAATRARLLSSTFFALQDTVTPFRQSIVRMIVSAAASAALVFGAVQVIHWQTSQAAIVIALASSLGAWVEFHLLRNQLQKILGPLRFWTKGDREVLLSASVAAATLSMMQTRMTELLPHMFVAPLVGLALFSGIHYLILVGIFKRPWMVFRLSH
ncbi:MAG TPA: murein biosynthesis integral membrane protein MurJ [Pseudobdellovibrionaceae bacterium]|nr:murein biosynthesis integral membrane protein MurJ [Pseudobdellovibrionaceae bacterium]